MADKTDGKKSVTRITGARKFLRLILAHAV